MAQLLGPPLPATTFSSRRADAVVLLQNPAVAVRARVPEVVREQAARAGVVPRNLGNVGERRAEGGAVADTQ